MSNLLEIQRLRADILKQAFSSSAKVVNLFVIGVPLSIEKEKLERIYFYLQDEGLNRFLCIKRRSRSYGERERDAEKKSKENFLKKDSNNETT